MKALEDGGNKQELVDGDLVYVLEYGDQVKALEDEDDEQDLEDGDLL